MSDTPQTSGVPRVWNHCASCKRLTLHYIDTLYCSVCMPRGVKLPDGTSDAEEAKIERFQQWVRTLPDSGAYATSRNAFDAGYQRGLEETALQERKRITAYLRGWSKACRHSIPAIADAFDAAIRGIALRAALSKQENPNG